jgi:CRP/FNR family transcriptional regulator, cyclic AMP receptor protein
MNRADHIAVFKFEESGTRPALDRILLPDWTNADWNKLLNRTRPQLYRTSEVVIQRGAVDRSLFLVVAGSLEVGITHVDGVSIAPLAKVTPGSVIGEQSFFDGQPRSANVWGVSDGELLRIEFEDFNRFSHEEPGLGRDLVFAVGRVLSSRLRNTTFRVRR